MIVMATLDPGRLDQAALAFLTERHLATLTTIRADGSPHVAPVGFSFDPSGPTVRIITFEGSMKVRHIHAGRTRVSVCQVDGGRWLTLEGDARVTNDAVDMAAAVAGYASRYRVPGERVDRVAIEFRVDRMLGRI